MPALVIGVNYRTDEHALTFARSLSRYSAQDLSIMLVDNTEREEPNAFCRLFSQVNSNLQYVLAPKNLGYFGGANYGLQRYLSVAAPPEWVLICNVDIEFQDDDFFRKLDQLKIDDSLGVVGPRIWSTRWKRDLNPKLTERPDRRRMQFYQIVFGNYYFQLTYEILSFLKNKSKAATHYLGAFLQQHQKNAGTEERLTEIYAAHGSCMIFSRNYFASGGDLKYSVFLFGEEIFVAETARRLGLSVAYCPSLSVVDREHASTGIIRSRKVAAYMKDATDYLVQKHFV